MLSVTLFKDVVEMKPAKSTGSPDEVLQRYAIEEFQSADRSLLISGPTPFDLVLGQVFTPNDSVAANEIVRAAREIPTTNGRKQRHSFAVKRQLPTNGTNWRHQLQAASATALWTAVA